MTPDPARPCQSTAGVGGVFVLLGVGPPPATPRGHWDLLHNFGENHLLLSLDHPWGEERRCPLESSEDEGWRTVPEAAVGLGAGGGPGIPRSPEHRAWQRSACQD